MIELKKKTASSDPSSSAPSGQSVSIPKVSLILASFKRAILLDLGLSSIIRYKTKFPLEIVVINDGIEDDTESVCDSYKNKLDIKYIFSGSRNKDGIKWRCPGFANNIGVKKSSGDIIVLSCPEIFHFNECLNILVDPLVNNRKYLTIPKFMYFDDTGKFTSIIKKKKDYNAINKLTLSVGEEGENSVQMPFFMGMWKKEFMDIRGYDEDFTGYAGDDNDLVGRLKLNGCNYHRTTAKIVHLYHGKRCDSQVHWENPDWVHNWNLYVERKHQIIRNIDRDWGMI